MPYKSIDTTILGFDIGGTKTGIVLGDLSAQILRRSELPTPTEVGFEAALSEMLAAAEALLGEAQANGLPAPQAVSVSIGGPLDIERGLILGPPHLPTWRQAPLKERLMEHFQLPVLVEHDGNAGALAEYYFGAGLGIHSMVYLTLGTGLGAGLILDGQLYRGASDTAGEVGHIRIAETGPLTYGKAGSWEGYCSATGLENLAHLRDPAAYPTGTKAQEIISSALKGDPKAVKLVEEMGDWLGRGLAVLVDILNPELIVLGTLGVLLGDLLIEPARRAMAE